MLNKVETCVELRVSFYPGQAFGTARGLYKTDVFEDGKLVASSEAWRKIDDLSAFQDVLTQEFIAHRSTLVTLREDFDAETATIMQEKHEAIAAKDAELAAARAAI